MVRYSILIGMLLLCIQSSEAQSIIGGAGILRVSGDPNLIPSVALGGADISRIACDDDGNYSFFNFNTSPGYRWIYNVFNVAPNRLRINNKFTFDLLNGRLGLNTTTPAFTFDMTATDANYVARFYQGYNVGTYTNLLRFESINNPAIGVLGLGGSNTGLSTNAMAIGTVNAYKLKLITNDIERIIIGETGKIGVNNPNPLADFDIIGTTKISSTLDMSSSKILNLANGTLNTDTVNVSQLNTKLSFVTTTSNLTGAGTSASPLDLSNTGVTPGTYSRVTTDDKGRITATGVGYITTEYTTPGSFTIAVPSTVKSIGYKIVGGGGGGAGGNKVAAGGTEYGGQSGGGGGYCFGTINKQSGLPTSLLIWVGVGGTGGNGASTIGLGSNGTNGGSSFIRNIATNDIIAIAKGGNGGFTSSNRLSYIDYGDGIVRGGYASGVNGDYPPYAIIGGCFPGTTAGGYGGGIDAGVAQSAQLGSASNNCAGQSASAGTIGGGAGQSLLAIPYVFLGTGGGGGGANTAGNGGNGGNGQNYGAGGGGGGTSIGGNGGNGGNGANGFVEITFYYQ